MTDILLALIGGLLFCKILNEELKGEHPILWVTGAGFLMFYALIAGTILLALAWGINLGLDVLGLSF